MHPTRPGLQAARRARGWSQAQAARELAELARASGSPAASPASLKSLLSRWENGHAAPEPQYRALLAELYGRTAAELDLAPAGPAGPDAPRARLRARLTAAAAVDDALLGAWAEQLALGRRLDDEVGAAGAAGVVGVLVDELGRTWVHARSPRLRARIARLLVPAATLAGWQELDRGDPEQAWLRFDRARTVAAAVAAADLGAEATAGLAATLVDLADPDAALALLDAVTAPRDAAALAWLEAARGAALAARGRSAEARRSFAAAELAAASHDPHGAPPHSDADPPAADAGPLGRQAAAGTRPLGAPQQPAHASPPAAASAGPPDVPRRRAVALAVLGEPDAAGELEAVLAGGVRSARDRAAVHAALAMALGTATPGAAEHARAARVLAERIGSVRAVALLATHGA